MRTVAIMNQKGGSAKTTTAVNLGAALAEAGQRVLVIDLDPQASASQWLGADDAGRGILDVFTGQATLESLVRVSTAAGVDVIPSSEWLYGVEKAVAGEPGAELIFKSALEQLPQRWEWVLIDCPPSLGFLTVSALVACREVVVAVEASAMSLVGVRQLLKTVEAVRSRLNPSLTLTGVLACKVNVQTRLGRDVIASLRQRFGAQVFETVVRQSIRVTESYGHRLPVTQYDPAGAGATDYRAVAQELLLRSA